MELLKQLLWLTSSHGQLDIVGEWHGHVAVCRGTHARQVVRAVTGVVSDDQGAWSEAALDQDQNLRIERLGAVEQEQVDCFREIDAQRLRISSTVFPYHVCDKERSGPMTAAASLPNAVRTPIKSDGGWCVARLEAGRVLDLYISMWQYSQMAMNETDHLSVAFAALADPTRRAILARLASGEADVSELMKPFALSQPTISKHLNVLERAGLVTRGRDAQRRPRTLVAVPLKDIADWMEPFRQFWEQKFDSLDGYLKRMQETSARKKRKPSGRTK
jgi:DNA-binding transcriptional ArsR family regulator